MLKSKGVMVIAQVEIDLLINEEVKKHIDPFYTESNMVYLKKVVEDIESGKVVLTEYELIED